MLHEPLVAPHDPPSFPSKPHEPDQGSNPQPSPALENYPDIKEDKEDICCVSTSKRITFDFGPLHVPSAATPVGAVVHAGLAGCQLDQLVPLLLPLLFRVNQTRLQNAR